MASKSNQNNRFQHHWSSRCIRLTIPTYADIIKPSRPCTLRRTTANLKSYLTVPFWQTHFNQSWLMSDRHQPDLRVPGIGGICNGNGNGNGNMYVENSRVGVWPPTLETYRPCHRPTGYHETLMAGLAGTAYLLDSALEHRQITEASYTGWISLGEGGEACQGEARATGCMHDVQVRKAYRRSRVAMIQGRLACHRVISVLRVLCASSEVRDGKSWDEIVLLA